MHAAFIRYIDARPYLGHGAFYPGIVHMVSQTGD